MIGSANADLVFRAHRCPRGGETLIGGDFEAHPGGKGANQAVTAARLGGAVAFVGCIGDDPFAKMLAASLEEAGVDVSRLRKLPGTSSGCAMILVEQSSGQNRIVVAPGANGMVCAREAREAVLAHPTVPVLAQLEIPMEAVLAASEAERFFLNPAPATDLPDALLSRTFCIVPNETEAAALTGIAPSDANSCRAAAQALLIRGARNVVITLGERGAYWTDGRDEALQPARPVGAVDTTGAGDAFCGALALGISRGLEFPAALGKACAVAALSTTKPGAQPAMPSAEDAGF